MLNIVIFIIDATGLIFIFIIQFIQKKYHNFQKSMLNVYITLAINIQAPIYMPCMFLYNINAENDNIHH